jgi:hypothetical protein
MKYVWMGLMVLMLGTGLVACGGATSETPETNASNPSPVAQAPASPSAPSSAANPSASSADASIKLGTFAFDEIYEIGAAGCGMTLWTREENAKPAGDRSFLLLSGLEADSMLMKINGETVRFRRTAASGDDFYGQFTSQTFSNEEKGVTVKVDVTLGERGEIESIGIPSGSVQVQMGSGTVEVPVVGDAGC